jgi:L-seryl-tRNA(Ser) seleniumtransferase
MDSTNTMPAAELLRRVPSVDALARSAGLDAWPERLVLREARRLCDELRTYLLGAAGSAVDADCVDPVRARAALAERVVAAAARHHRRVVNATGIVLHTGIGRAPLADAAVRALGEAARYAVVEVEPRTGQRNQREEAVAALLGELTGAGGALVVNNNAAAVNLTLRALAAGREVVVSRGELVEIGGGFRMPDVMAEAGCRMVEVGATNRTHLRDYERAIGAATGMLLKVHPSNFRIVGFHAMPGLAELVGLGRARGVPVFEDLGSGLLLDEPPDALRHEAKVLDSLRAGLDLCCFSGDKLLGGPQCGILLGDPELVARVRAHPLYRAFRCDKLTLAALEATLRIYRDGEPLREVPTLRAIAAAPEQLRIAAEGLAERLSALGASVRPSDSFVGSGANPARPLPSFAVVLPGGERVAEALRRRPPVPVFARVAEDLVWLDLRTLFDEDQDELVRLVLAACPG